MKYLVLAVIACSVIVMASIFWRAFSLDDEELPPAPPPKPPVVRPIVPTTLSTTAPTTTTTTARARTAPTVAAASASRPGPAVSTVAPSERWLALADCESGDGDGRAPYSMTDDYRGLHHGALQWHPDTWTRARRMSGLPVAASAADAPFVDEVAVAKVWLRATSPRQWPVCGPKVGLTMADAA